MRRKVLVGAILLSLAAASLWSQAVTDWRQAALKNVFEVVLRKPDADPVVYQEKLPLELLPYSERMDTQSSIGTAFSIGHGRFVSAAHVFFLESQTLRAPFSLRDSAGKVYPVGNVLAYSNRRDYIVFDVPGLEAEGLPLSRDFSMNAKIYAVGNALGEGVVIRDGLLTSTTPEERNGEWAWLRFSAAASPGNSGGPLLDDKGQAIGIVTRKSENENLNYALPVAQLDLAPVATEDVRDRYHLPNLTRDAAITGVTTFALPMPLETLRQKVHTFFFDLAFTAGDTLTKDTAALFPLAPGSGPALGANAITVLPRFVAQQPDGTWSVQGVDKPMMAQVGEQGNLQFGPLWKYTSFSLTRPHGVPLSRLFGQPRTLMDLILQGYPLSRTVSTKQIRITSFGDPAAIDRFQDRYGRRWVMVRWDVPWGDYSEVLMALPTPTGAAGILVGCPYADWPMVEYDISFLSNFLVLSYSARLDEWEEFVASPDLRPQLLDSLSLTYLPGASLTLDTPRLDLSFTSSLLGITHESRLILTPAYFREGASGVWDLASLYVDQNGSGRSYIGVFKVPRPDTPSSDQAKQSWASITNDSYPFNGGSYQANGLTTIWSARHPLQAGTRIADPMFQYAAILSFEGSLSSADAQTRFNLFKNGFLLKPLEESLARPGGASAPVSSSQPGMENGKTIFQAVAMGDEEALSAFIAAGKDLEALNEDQRTPLLLALRLGRNQMAARLVSAGVNTRSVDRFGNTPLILALRYADPATARRLVEKGTDVSRADPDGFTPLMIAMPPQFGDLPDLLLAQGAEATSVTSKNTTVLMYALNNGRGALGVELARRGAPLNLVDSSGWTALMYALRHCDEATAMYLINQGSRLDGTTTEGWTPLHIAVRYSTLDVLKVLLDAGTRDLNASAKDGLTPLMLEAEYGNQDAELALLAAGADPLARDQQGWTPLSYALRYGDAPRTQAIVGRLSKIPDADQKGWTALHFAARYLPAMLPAVSQLAGADVNARMNAGWTPLHLAVENGSLSAVQWLTQNKADLSIRNENGKTALDLAHDEHKAEIEAFLRASMTPGGKGAAMVSTEFDGPTLDASFALYLPKTGPDISLTANPGFLKMELPSSGVFDHWHSVDDAPQIRCEPPSGDWEMTTSVSVITPRFGNYVCGLEVVLSQYDVFYFGIFQGRYIELERSGVKSIFTSACPAIAGIKLRIRKSGTTYDFSYRGPSDTDWIALGRQTVEQAPIYLGLIGKTWSPINFVADYDYVHITPN